MTIHTTPEAAQRSPVPPVARPTETAHVIKSDAEAIETAHVLASAFAEGAAERDRERIWPVAELDAFSQSGLWSINVPRAHGGPELSYVTLSRVIAIIAEADPSLAQIPQNHLGVVAAIRTVSDEAQKKLLFAEVLAGTRFGNAFSEFGSRRAAEFQTTFTDEGDHVIVNGRKFYCTGALLAHPGADRGARWRGPRLVRDRRPRRAGPSVIDDWSSMGQRTTLSGTVILDNVKVPKTHLVPGYKGYEAPSADGAIFQVIQAAIDLGIAEAAIRDTIAFVRNRSRPWVDSGLDHAWQDPYTIQAVGDLKLRVNATAALLDRAGSPSTRGRRADRRLGRRGADRRRRGQGPQHRDRYRRHQQAVRAGRHPLDAGRAQPRPPLAQRPHPHAARPGAVEVLYPRQLLPERHQPALPRLELTGYKRPRRSDVSTSTTIDRRTGAGTVRPDDRSPLEPAPGSRRAIRLTIEVTFCSSTISTA